jgi:hypothetical protein
MNAFPPMRGIFDMSKIGAAVTVMRNEAIYILIGLGYGPGKEVYEYIELVFTPYFSGLLQNNPTDEDNRISFLAMIELRDGVYQLPGTLAGKVVFATEDSGQNMNNIIKVHAVALRISGKNLVAYLDGDTGTPYNIEFVSAQDSTNTMAVLSPFSSTDVTLTAEPADAYYDQDPNYFAGMPYILDYSDNTNKVFPFRFLDVLNDEPADQVFIQPSTCIKGGGSELIHPSPYLCNLLTIGDGDTSNLLFFLKMYIGGDVKATPTDRAVLIKQDNSIASDNFLNSLYFLPTNFYQANFTVSGNKVFAPSIPCVQSTNIAQVLNNFYYFWASGFTQYSNEKDLSKFNPMIVASAPGFIGQGPAQPVSVTSWTNLSDCQRSYFYNYCSPSGSNSTCGTCFGGCPSAILPCTANERFTPTNIVNVNPFTCTGNIHPINFWDKWKYWIIAGAIVLGIFIVGVIIIVVLIGSKKGKPVDNSAQNDPTIVYR